MCDRIEDPKIIAHQERLVPRVFRIRSLDFQSEQFSSAHFFDIVQAALVNQVPDYGLAFGIAGLWLIGYHYFN
jgi:hypothetical protein